MEKYLVILNIVILALLLIQFLFNVVLVKTLSEFLNRFRAGGQVIKKTSLLLGEKAPLFNGRNQEGREISLVNFIGKPTLLFFALDTCEVCHNVIEKLHLMRQQDPLLEIVVMTAETDTSSQKFDQLKGIDVIRSSANLELFFVKKVPFFFQLDREGYIVKSDSVTSFEDLVTKIGK